MELIYETHTDLHSFSIHTKTAQEPGPHFKYTNKISSIQKNHDRKLFFLTFREMKIFERIINTPAKA